MIRAIGWKREGGEATVGGLDRLTGNSEARDTREGSGML